MISARLVIVAPDPDLRRSLEFALEAEGYYVTSHAAIFEAVTPENYDCTILDHRAIAGPTEEALVFCRRAKPLILLAGAPLPWLAEHVFQTVQKPLLGEPLCRAVREALAAETLAKDH